MTPRWRSQRSWASWSMAATSPTMAGRSCFTNGSSEKSYCSAGYPDHRADIVGGHRLPVLVKGGLEAGAACYRLARGLGKFRSMGCRRNRATDDLAGGV